MPEHSTSPEQTHGEHKLFGKHKWRGKLFSKDGKEAKSAGNQSSYDSDISQFLGSSAGETKEPEKKDDVKSETRTFEINDSHPESLVPRLAEEEPVHRKRKSPRREGLAVRFKSTAPEIIGEGGDGAESPPTSVAKPQQRNAGIHQFKHQGLLSETPGAVSPPTGEMLTKASYRPSTNNGSLPITRPLRRTSTGFEHPSSRQPPSAQNSDSDTSHRSPSPVSALGHQMSLSPEAANHRDIQIAMPEIRLEDQDILPAKPASRIPESYFNLPDPRDGQSRSPSPRVLAYHSKMPASNSLTPLPSPKPALATPSPRLSPKTSSSPSPERRRSPDGRFVAERDSIVDQYVDKVVSPPKESRGRTLKDIAKDLGGDAFEDFYVRTRRFNDVFRIGLASRGPLMEVRLRQWVRMSIWWFLKGRAELESIVRKTSQPDDPLQLDHDTQRTRCLKQAYLDLAKAWWIAKEIIPNHPEPRKYGTASLSSLVPIIKNFGNTELADLLEVHLTTASNMRALAISMKRNAKLPSDTFEIQRLDTRVWVPYPFLRSVTGSGPLVDHESQRPKPFFSIPVGDTKRHFIYGRMFVDVILTSEDDTHEVVHFPCILSVLRDHREWSVMIVIVSQDGQISLTIQSDKAAGLTWNDVRWKTRNNALHLKLSNSAEALVQFSESDFRSLWGIHDYSQKVLKNFQPSKTEEIVFDYNLRNFQQFDSQNSGVFPAEHIKDCQLRLFEDYTVSLAGNVERKAHNGYRLVVVTPPSIKILSSINCNLGNHKPILYRFLKTTTDTHSMMLKLSEGSKDSSLVLVFYKAGRELFHSLLDGSTLAYNEHCTNDIGLKGFRVACKSFSDLPTNPGEDLLNRLRWYKLRVISCSSQETHAKSPSVNSENLRVLLDCEFGRFDDRINLGAGQLRLQLSVDNLTEITLQRPPQTDLTVCFAENQFPRADTKNLQQALEEIRSAETTRTYDFYSLNDLHEFQAWITGFSVSFDGHATNFAISRRRMVVPIHKRWEATSARLQLVQQPNRTTQLVAFFKDFHHGESINFVLKSTDSFETFERSGMFFVRIVDAKFALPKAGEGVGFVSLDLPEYPGEHDDVVVGFADETERESFANALPAPVRHVSRMASLRRG